MWKSFKAAVQSVFECFRDIRFLYVVVGILLILTWVALLGYTAAILGIDILIFRRILDAA